MERIMMSAAAATQMQRYKVEEAVTVRIDVRSEAWYLSRGIWRQESKLHQCFIAS